MKRRKTRIEEEKKQKYDEETFKIPC